MDQQQKDYHFGHHLGIQAVKDPKNPKFHLPKDCSGATFLGWFKGFSKGQGIEVQTESEIYYDNVMKLVRAHEKRITELEKGKV